MLVGVVEAWPDRVADVVVGQRGQVDHGVFQALAGVDGDELDGCRVRVEAAGVAEAAPGAALGDLLAQPGEQRGEPPPPGQGHLVECLANVPQVGEAAVAADLGQHLGRQASLGRRSSTAAMPRPAKSSTHDRSTSATSSVRSSPPASISAAVE